MNDFLILIIHGFRAIFVHYKIDLVGSHAYLNRAALVGCKNQLLSENYAKQAHQVSQ
jgi:hypothetical protein